MRLGTGSECHGRQNPGGSDGTVFDPSTMEAFSTHGNGTMTIVKENGPTSFEVEQNYSTHPWARERSEAERTKAWSEGCSPQLPKVAVKQWGRLMTATETFRDSDHQQLVVCVTQIAH
jgi:hypothetical protein